MNNSFKNFTIFAIGAAIGSIVTWKLVKDKYAQISRSEIEEMREYYGARKASEQPKVIDPEADKEAEAYRKGLEVGISRAQYYDYTKILEDHGYTSDAKAKENEPRVPVIELTDPEGPYVISPEELGDCGYDIVTYTYWADGVLTNELNEPIEDISTVIGNGSLNHFGDYEPDSVHIRDDTLKMDIEILLDLRAYEDMIAPTVPDNSEE